LTTKRVAIPENSNDELEQWDIEEEAEKGKTYTKRMGTDAILSILEKSKYVHSFCKKICKTFFNHTQHVISSPNEIEFDHKICCFRFLTKRGSIRVMHDTVLFVRFCSLDSIANKTLL